MQVSSDTISLNMILIWTSIVFTFAIAITALIKALYMIPSYNYNEVANTMENLGFMKNYTEIFPSSISLKNDESADDTFTVQQAVAEGGGTVTFGFQDQEVYFDGSDGQLIYHFSSGDGGTGNMVEFKNKQTGNGWCYNYDNSTECPSSNNIDA